MVDNLFLYDYGTAISDRATDIAAAGFASQFGQRAALHLRNGDALARTVGYMGEKGALDFFSCGALNSGAASSFTFERPTVGGSADGVGGLIVGTDPAFERLVPIPAGRTDISQRMDVIAQTDRAQGTIRAEFVPKMTTDAALTHQAVSACVSALDAILNSNAIMLKNGRDMHRSQSATERVAGQVFFFACLLTSFVCLRVLRSFLLAGL